MAHLEAIGIKMKQIVLKIMLCFRTAHVPFICIIHYTSFEMNDATFHSSYVFFSELKKLSIIKLVWITASLVIL